jgi:exopolysaccharide biosynthesis polyprenyl glycosylphosphotransferase
MTSESLPLLDSPVGPIGDAERTVVPLRGRQMAGAAIPAEPFSVDAATRDLERVGAPRLRWALVGLDAMSTLLAWAFALAVPWSVLPAGAAVPTALTLELALVTAVCLTTISGQRLYQARVCGVRAVEVARLARAAAVAGAVAYLGGRALGLALPAERLVGGALLSFVLLASSRSLFDAWLKSSRARGRFSRPVVIVGANDEAFDLYRLLHTHPEIGFRISGVIGSHDECAGWGNDVPWLGELDDTLRAVVASGATGVVIAASAVPSDQLNLISRALLTAGVHVHLSSGLKGISRRRLRSLPLAYEPLFYLEPAVLARWQLTVKRILDVVVASVVLLLTSPVLVAAAIAIKLQDRGPVLFRQERIGRKGRMFTVLKLRTMVPGAEALKPEVESLNERNGGPLFKAIDDPRRTRVGRILESTSIDELPQLVNVLRGEMSLVGPRPALPDEVGRFDDELLARLSVAPGITGLWQVEARDNPAFYAYRRLDLFYVENWSVTLDLAILLATMRALVMRPFHRGERAPSGRQHPLYLRSEWAPAPPSLDAS